MDLDFYFDFSSPYAYFASTRIEALAARHGATVNWRPYLMGAVFKVTGIQPIVDYPLKGDYARRDLDRSARRLGIAFGLPAQFPFGTVTACRAFYSLVDKDRAGAVRLAHALFQAAFTKGRDICPVEQVSAIAASVGFDREAVARGIQDPAVKERLKREVDAAIARGVFGSPMFFVGDEPFWGNDRLDEVEEWLARGGW
jgi:2-hydroxychromene-2-carboxylate isomerase